MDSTSSTNAESSRKILLFYSSRNERFKDHLVTGVSAAAEDEKDNRLNPLKRFRGFSTDLEKPYLRLTSAPKAAAVRPLKILRYRINSTSLFHRRRMYQI